MCSPAGSQRIIWWFSGRSRRLLGVCVGWIVCEDGGIHTRKVLSRKWPVALRLILEVDDLKETLRDFEGFRLNYCCLSRLTWWCGIDEESRMEGRDQPFCWILVCVFFFFAQKSHRTPRRKQPPSLPSKYEKPERRWRIRRVPKIRKQLLYLAQSRSTIQICRYPRLPRFRSKSLFCLLYNYFIRI